MKSLHWNNFGPVTSKVDSFYGGINPPYEFALINSNINTNIHRPFCSITYRLQVNSMHNGWHHFLAMFANTNSTGPSFSNACVKQFCREGEYQFVFHFSFIRPYLDSNTAFLQNCFDTSLFWQQNATFNTNTVEANGQLRDIVLFQPSLVDPANCNNRQNLWDPTAYDGGSDYMTGYPLVDPNLMQGVDYDL